ncbi:MAG: restriction endonuclease subunit S [Anaerolineales bacterium]|nr:restriction endonuclease subunit S [Anaerolineales bacterium]
MKRPDFWEEIPLGRVSEVKSGSGFPKRYQGLHEEEFPFFKVGDMNTPGNEVEMRYHEHSISEETRKKIRATVFPKNSIIFPKIGAAIATNKKRILVRPSCVDNNVMVVIPSDQILPQYLYFLFLAKNLSDFASDANPPSMRKTEVESWRIPVPPPPEQARIVAILRQADALRHLRQEARDKADGLIAAIFYEMFGDPIVAKNNWREYSLSEFVEIEASLVDPKEEEYSQYFHVGSDNIESETGRLIDLQTIEEVGSISGKFPFSHESILYSKIRPALRKVATPNFGGLCSADIYPLSYKEKVRKQFLAQLLRTEHFTAYTARVSGRAQIPKINQTDLLSYETILPDISSQVEFELRAQEALRHLTRLEESTLYFDQLFASLLARAFSGELTAVYRDQHQAELQEAAAERDRLLGLRGEEPRLIDFKEGRVTPAEEERFRQSVQKAFKPAIQDLLASLGTSNVFESLARQINFPSFADLIRPALPTYENLVGDILADSVASTSEVVRTSLANNFTGIIAESIAPLTESIRLSNEAFYKSLGQSIMALAEAQVRQAVEQEPPQPDRAIHAELDSNARMILQAVQALPTYFTPLDLHQLILTYSQRFDGYQQLDLVQVETALNLLETLGFICQVVVDERLVFRLVNPVEDGALLPEELAG